MIMIIMIEPIGVTIVVLAVAEAVRNGDDA